MARRQIIVNADDFGLSDGVNAGILRCAREGIVTSASLMVHGPAATGAAVAEAAACGLELGLHCDFGEWAQSGEEWTQVYRRADVDDEASVRAEALRQLDLYRTLTGALPAHIDSHQHVHRREPARTVLLEIARSINVPLRFFTHGIQYCGRFYGHDEMGKSALPQIAAAHLVEILRAIPEGTTELCCHPGAEPVADSAYGDERIHEMNALCDPCVRAVLEESGIELCSFGAVRPANGVWALDGVEGQA